MKHEREERIMTHLRNPRIKERRLKHDFRQANTPGSLPHIKRQNDGQDQNIEIGKYDGRSGEGYKGHRLLREIDAWDNVWKANHKQRTHYENARSGSIRNRRTNVEAGRWTHSGDPQSKHGE